MAQVIMDHGVSWCFGTSLAPSEGRRIQAPVPGSINQWNPLRKFTFDNGSDLVLNLDIARDLRSR